MVMRAFAFRNLFSQSIVIILTVSRDDLDDEFMRETDDALPRAGYRFVIHADLTAAVGLYDGDLAAADTDDVVILRQLFGNCVLIIGGSVRQDVIACRILGRLAGRIDQDAAILIYRIARDLMPVFIQDDFAALARSASAMRERNTRGDPDHHEYRKQDEIRFFEHILEHTHASSIPYATLSIDEASWCISDGRTVFTVYPAISNKYWMDVRELTPSSIEMICIM